MLFAIIKLYCTKFMIGAFTDSPKVAAVACKHDQLPDKYETETDLTLTHCEWAH